MRYRIVPPRRMASAFAACVTLVGLLSTPALAAQPDNTPTAAAPRAAPPPSPTGATLHAVTRPAVRERPLTPAHVPPPAPTRPPVRPSAPPGTWTCSAPTAPTSPPTPG